MRRYASGMTEPVHPPLEETALVWELAGEGGWADDVIPGYPGSGHHEVDLADVDVRADIPEQEHRFVPDVVGLEAGHFLG